MSLNNLEGRNEILGVIPNFHLPNIAQKNFKNNIKSHL